MAKCKITVLKRNYYPELAAEYCADKDPGPCPNFQDGQEIIIDKDAYFKCGNGFCSEAWQAISHYVYAAIQGGALMKGWMKEDNTMITCCNDGVRPVVYKLERIED